MISIHLLRIIVVFLFMILNSCNSKQEYFYDSEITSFNSLGIEEFKNKTVIESCEEIQDWKYSRDWKKIKNESLIRLDSEQNDKWLRFHFENKTKSEREWYFVLKWTTLDFAEFCSPLHEKDFETQLSGIQIQFKNWPIHTYFPSFRFWLEPKESSVYYFRVKSITPIAMPVKILSLNEFLSETRKISGINFLFFGFALFYILYNFIHYLESKDIIHIYINIFVVSLSMAVLSRFGIAYELIWGDYPNWQVKAVYVFLGISVFGALEFTRRFLNIHKFYKRLNVSFIVLEIVGILYSMIALIFNLRLYLSQFFAFFFIFLVLFIFISSLRVIVQKNYKPAKLFLGALPAFLITSILNVIFHLNLWDYNRFWIYTFMFFMPISFVFIALSVRDRITGIKLEAESNRTEIKNLLSKLEQYSESKPKYLKTQLVGIDVEKMIIKLINLMENEKIYYNENLSLEDVALKLEISRHQLSEILNRILGIPFNKFIQDYRIREAMELIRKREDLNILNIAFEVGFQSKSVFNTAFKKKCGNTPIEYRRKVHSGKSELPNKNE